MLALQKTNGYIKFSLGSPRVDAAGVQRFEIMTVTYDSNRISPDMLARIIADASGLKVQIVEP